MLLRPAWQIRIALQFNRFRAVTQIVFGAIQPSLLSARGSTCLKPPTVAQTLENVLSLSQSLHVQIAAAESRHRLF